MSNLNLKSISKPTIIIFAAIALIAVIGLAVAVSYVYQPSNDLTLKENAPAPTQITTTLTSDKASGEFNSGDTLTLIATLSQPLEGVTVAFQEVIGSTLGGPGYGTTNAQGIATFTFTPSAVSVATNRVFRATPQA